MVATVADYFSNGDGYVSIDINIIVLWLMEIVWVERFRDDGIVQCKTENYL